MKIVIFFLLAAFSAPAFALPITYEFRGRPISNPAGALTITENGRTDTITIDTDLGTVTWDLVFEITNGVTRSWQYQTTDPAAAAEAAEFFGEGPGPPALFVFDPAGGQLGLVRRLRVFGLVPSLSQTQVQVVGNWEAMQIPEPGTASMITFGLVALAVAVKPR